MKAKIEIVEDTITTYADYLTEAWDEQEEPLLTKLAYDYIKNVHPKVASGTLRSSGEEEDNWEFLHGEDVSEVTIEYTGRDNPTRWWEFGGFEPFSEWRDYAWFQETGEDDVAEPYPTMRRWYVRAAAYESKHRILTDTQKHFMNVLRG